MAKPHSFFYRIDASHLLQQVLRIDGAKARGEWITAVALQLVTHDGENDFANELIAEARKFSEKRSIAGSIGNELRWQNDRIAIANDRNAIAKVSPVAVAEAITETVAVKKERKSVGDISASLQSRQTAFGLSLKSFLSEYSRDMLHEFYSHWSEPTPSGKKMRFELERTWDIGRRLAKWASNHEKWNKGKSSAKSEESQLRDIYAQMIAEGKTEQEADALMDALEPSWRRE